MNDSLETLLADGIIEAVIGQLKTGKEAEVWLVQHASQVVAAKLYKERHERNFRNNVGYREGREVRSSRTRRAMEKGSRFGQAAAEEAWKSAEADSLYKLHAQGVRVPTPVMFYEGILLMELVVDAEGQPAPRLVEAPPATPEDAEALYLDLRAQVVRMLCADLIHGDLSPYNILMSGNGATIIDFPQTVAAARNNRAEFYFRRDLDNILAFLAGISPRLWDLDGDSGEIWNAYVRRDLTPDFQPSGARRSGGAKRRTRIRPQDFALEPVAEARPEPVPAVPVEPGLDPEEAELRALEALVLKQGGGERGKPAAMPAPRGGRNKRPFSPGGRPPPRTGGNGAAQSAGPRPPRPPQGAQGGAPGAQRGAPNGPTNANPGRPPRHEQRGPRDGSGPRQAEGPSSGNPDPRNGGGPRQDRAGRPPRANGPSGNDSFPQGSNGANGSDAVSQRAYGANTNTSRPPRVNGPNGNDSRPPRRNGSAGNDSRAPRMSGPKGNGSFPQGTNGANGNDSRAQGAKGPAGNDSRPPRNNGPRAGGENSRPPRNGERRGGGPGERPRQDASREPRANDLGGSGNGGGQAPRQPRHQRPGPQVSYVGDRFKGPPSGPRESGS